MEQSVCKYALFSHFQTLLHLSSSFSPLVLFAVMHVRFGISLGFFFRNVAHGTNSNTAPEMSGVVMN